MSAKKNIIFKINTALDSYFDVHLVILKSKGNYQNGGKFNAFGREKIKIPSSIQAMQKYKQLQFNFFSEAQILKNLQIWNLVDWGREMSLAQGFQLTNSVIKESWSTCDI